MATRTGACGGVYVMKRHKRTGKIYRQYLSTKRARSLKPRKRKRSRSRTKSRRRKAVRRKPWWNKGPSVSQIPTVVDANTAVPTLIKLDKALKREDRKDQIKFEANLKRTEDVLISESGGAIPSAPPEHLMPPLERDSSDEGRFGFMRQRQRVYPQTPEPPEQSGSLWDFFMGNY